MFCFLGALGLLRMPDVYNRIQAGTKAVTLGSLSLLLGVGLHHPEWWAKLLVIALFILLTNPDRLIDPGTRVPQRRRAAVGQQQV